MDNSVSDRSFLIDSDEEDDAAAAVEDGKRRGHGGDESDDGSDSSSSCGTPRVAAAGGGGGGRGSQPSSYTQQWPQSYRFADASSFLLYIFFFSFAVPRVNKSPNFSVYSRIISVFSILFWRVQFAIPY
jgi:hypothetical protein